MSRDERLFDKIEAYLRGKLPAEEAAAFEAEMSADAELSRQVRAQRIELQGLEWLVERDLRTKMDAWEREVEQAPTPLRVSFVRRWWVGGAAAMLVLALFGWWLLQPRQTDIGGPQPIVSTPDPATSPQDTPVKNVPQPPRKAPQKQPDRIAEKSSPKPPVVTKPQPVTPAPPATDYPALAAAYYRDQDFMDASAAATGESPLYGQALDRFKSGNYAAAEKLLAPVIKLNPNALKTKELLAHSLYKGGRYDAALPYLRELAASKDKSVAERSEWAMALTLLHRMPGQKPLLDRVLDKITSRPGHAFYRQADELKQKLK
ncbi:MAG: hypothetical protein KDC61_02475 [Saprospiraceae bacterium]|nr:hypothetical protein [Saprospiraceae bacterium]